MKEIFSRIFRDFSGPGPFIDQKLFFDGKTVFLDSSTQNHAESFRNLIEKSVLDTKRAKVTKSLVSGIWFLSPEAGGTLSRDPGEPWRAAASTAL